MKTTKGLTIVEALVCLVIIGIGFIAVNQLISFSVASMDRSLERTKVTFLSEMVIEDMLGDRMNASNYSFFEKCDHSASSADGLSNAQKNKWRDKFRAANQIIVDGKEKKPKCFKDLNDEKRALVNSSDKTGVTGRFIFKTNKGSKIKYLGVGLK